MRMSERSRVADTKVSAGEGQEGGAPSTGVEIPLQPMVQTMLRQDVSLEIPRRTNSHLHPLKDPKLVQVQVHV